MICELNWKGIFTLSQDEDLRMNVKNSSPSAYEAAVIEKFSDLVSQQMLDGILSGNEEKAEHYTSLSADINIQKQICNSIIRKIKDYLNLAS